MAWNDLTLSDRARMMQMAVKSGITDLRTIQEVYNKFDEGGPKKSLMDRLVANAERLKAAEPAGDESREAYISKMIDIIRNNALSKSRTRTMPRYVSTEGWAEQPETATNDEYIQGLVEDIETAIRNADAYANAKNAEDAVQNYGMRASIQPFINSDDRSEREHARLSELRIAQNLKKLKEEEENNDSGAWNCLATATDNYGPQYVESSNPIFAKNPQKYGFLQIPVADAKPGDIIQHTVYDETYGKGEPHHALILNRYDDAGRARFNYSTGVYTKDAIVKDGGYFSPLTVPFDDNNYNAFRFVGTPADSLIWSKEYDKLSKDNEYALGGPKKSPMYTWLVKRMRNIGTPIQKVSNEHLVNAYTNDVLWTMENPRNKGYNPKDGLYYAYTDRDANGNIHTNIGPGIEKNGHPNVDYGRGYTREELNEIARETVAQRVGAMRNSLETMQGGKYAITSDTLSLGSLLALTDIAYNAKTSDKKNLPEKWPNLIKALSIGDLEVAKTQTRSGSDRRRDMRNDLLTYGPITSKTVKNR